MYKAIICKVYTRPHPNADRLLLGDARGTQVIVGIDTQDGELGILFPSEGQLSEKYAKANDLIAYTDDQGVRRGGFFAQNRRVRTQRFRGEKSDGYFAPLSSIDFAYTNGDYGVLQEGDEFDTINGVPICNKYFTPATLRAMQGVTKKNHVNTYFAQHFETKQFRHEVGDIPEGSIIYITEKLHGTSGRFGYVLDEKELPRTWWQKLLRRPATKIVDFDHLLGTRRVIFGKYTGTSYYGSEAFRVKSVEDLNARLFKGEIIYYELVGWTDTGTPIMPPADTTKLQDKELKKKYGNLMHYSYGCDPALARVTNCELQCDLFVYRITRVTDDGHVTELSWPQVKARAAQLQLKTVPDLEGPYIFGDEFVVDELGQAVDDLVEGSSTIDSRHVREGVVVRVETPGGDTYFLKHKSFTFKVLEGMAKEADTYVDMEEVA